MDSSAFGRPLIRKEMVYSKRRSKKFPFTKLSSYIALESARFFAHARFRAFSHQCLSVVFRESSVKLGNVSRGSDMNFGRASTICEIIAYLAFFFDFPAFSGISELHEI
jgi:hypothetical protein